MFVHKIGTPSSEDILILKENDHEYDINLIQSNSKKYAYINIEATNQNEIYLINLDNPLNTPKLFLERSESHLYYLEHKNDHNFFILTNYDSPNFQILTSSSLDNLSMESLDTLVGHDKNIFISNILYEHFDTSSSGQELK